MEQETSVWQRYQLVVAQVDIPASIKESIKTTIVQARLTVVERRIRGQRQLPECCFAEVADAGCQGST